jgi:hypothetical protein
LFQRNFVKSKRQTETLFLILRLGMKRKYLISAFLGMLSIKSNSIFGHFFDKKEGDSYLYVDIDSISDDEWLSYKEDKINLQNDLNNLKKDTNKAIKEYKKENG